MSISLDQLRATLQESQRTGNNFPTEPARQIVVGREGEINLGGDVRPSEQTTKVPQEVFA